MKQQELFDTFRDRLPRRPLATDDFTAGVYHLPAIQAIRSKYLQHNRPMLTAWIVVDVDRPGGGWDWYDLDGPAPNIVVENPENLHAHLFYGLEAPVLKDSLNARLKPLRYAAAVEYGIVSKLEADQGYGGLLSKNPLYKGWNVRTYEQWLYDLDWLADYVDLPDWRDLRRKLPDYGIGRNCTLFDNLRKWSYRARRNVDWPGYDSWMGAVLTTAANMNSFTPPLPFTEVKATARSVAKWTWAHIIPEAFPEIQSRRGKKSGEARRLEAARRAQRVFSFMEENPDKTQREAAEETGVPLPTVKRYVGNRKVSRTKSDIPPSGGLS